MKKILLLLVLLSLAAGAYAQTRRIAHRSHSGAKHEKYDGHDGNYGNPPMMRKVHLESGRDTIMFFGDSLVRPESPDTIRPQRFENHIMEMQDIDQFGWVAGKLAV